jgi:cell surface protein SprA
MPDADTNGGGPSRLYQLGLVSDPSSTLRWTGRFPFFEPIAYRGPDGWVANSIGLRAKNGRLTNDFSQKNDIALKTNRPLWEGASLEINWKVGWQYRKTTNLETDSILGLPIQGSTKSGGSVERSYMSLPPVLFFKFFKSNLENVGKKYEENINSAEYANKPGAAAADAFEKGMEALPFLNKFLGQFVPRANWALRWSGVEKVTGISDWVQSMSLDHSYRSSFRRDFHISDDGSEQTDVERISYDFAPLIGLQTTFKEVWKGNLSGNFQYKTSTAYDLSLTNQKITEDLTTEMSLSLNYSRRGFEFPLFGLNLKNDLEFSFTYSRALKTRRQHDPVFLQSNQEGTPLDGNIRTTMEPRIRYTLSARVTASLFYRYSRTAPDEGGSTIPGTTTNEAGVDIHISIQ